jgi:uncharacterized damage-inducible protein DinB
MTAAAPVAAGPAAPFAQELHAEAAATRRLLDRLPADRLSWRPHPKSQTLGQLAMHVATIPSIAERLLAKDAFDVTGANFAPAQPTSVGEVRAAFDASMESASRTLSAWTERDLAATWRMTAGPKELMSQPRRAMLRTLVCNHLVHHRGQLTVYLRLLDVPLPSVYGPSADEAPFGL